MTTENEQPQNCPHCGAEPTVVKLGARSWRVTCSNNAGRILHRCTDGHPMFTRKDAIKEWNKLK